MKLYINIIASLLISLGIVSCEKNIPPTLSLSTTQADIANFDGKIEIAVTSNSNWTATVSDIWCTITPRSGSGDGVITVTATNNYTNSGRTATLQVICQDLKKTTSITQSFSQLSVDNQTLLFEKEASTQVLKITSNTKWQLELPASETWLSANVISGEGNTDVVFTVNANTLGPARSAQVLLKYGSTQMIISVSQKRSSNSAPSIPVLSFPANGSANVTTIPGFTWSASTDADNDVITYKLSYSKDNVNWTELTTTKTQLYLASHLTENSTYSWKIVATDTEGASASTSVFTFTTGAKSGYVHGEYKVHQNASFGLNGKFNEILFMGDGYVASDFQEGALFDQNVTEGINDFFSVEPYKSYRGYFTVYKQATYSTDSGATQTDKNITKILP